jgi:hypothetical protein
MRCLRQHGDPFPATVCLHDLNLVPSQRMKELIFIHAQHAGKN